MKRIIAWITALMMIMTGMAGAMGEEERIWRRGDSGETVKQIQEKLIELEYLEGEASGTFDEATEEALRRFQWDQGLLETGMAERVTLEVLMKCEEHARIWEYGVTWDMYEESGLAEMLTDGAAYAVSAPGGLAKTTSMWNGMPAPMPVFSTDEYTRFDSNRFLSAGSNPLSTFAADVDTSSYAQFRRRVLNGDEVPPDSIRIEEMLNYFRYDYRRPEGTDPFGVTVEYAACPWNPKTRLMQIGLQAREVPEEERPAHQLVFLIDTSGSMEGADRLDLVRRAFLELLEELKEGDTVSIVAYASQDRVVLEGVPATEKTRIMEAITTLEARGGTNGSAGIQRAYEIAEKYFIQGGVNRILLATDGDLNMGITSEGELARLVEQKKESGIGLTCLGFGMGNYKDNKMEALADYGDGNCWYIDSIHEARKALVTEGGGSFITVAKDVKIQVDFNPALIRGYRLIGYEDRLMAAEDFADDRKDGGEIGSGHRVTALYEIVPADSDFDFGEAVSRYQNAGDMAADPQAEMLTVSIRAKEPEGDESRLYTFPVHADILTESMSDNMKFAAAVAEVGMILRGSEWKGEATYDSALALLRDCGSVRGDVYREEFLYLVNLLNRR